MGVNIPQSLSVQAFTVVNGRPLFRIPLTNASWVKELNAAGSLTVETAWCRELAAVSPHETLQPWKVGLALLHGDKVVQAGIITARKWDTQTQSLSFTCKDLLELLDRRLVLNPGLINAWKDGVVSVDEEHPMGVWQSVYEGSLTDIATMLVRDTLTWGSLPADLPEMTGGNNIRTYAAPDLCTIMEELEKLTSIQDGIELLVDPYRDEHGYYRWRFRAETEICDHSWMFDTGHPGQKVILSSIDEDTQNMTDQAFLTGGKNNDEILVARAYTSFLQNQGYPLLQVGDATHATVSELPTLQAYAEGLIQAGGRQAETYQLKISADYPVSVGDHIRLRFNDPYAGRGQEDFKIVKISGDTSEWLSVDMKTLNELYS